MRPLPVLIALALFATLVLGGCTTPTGDRAGDGAAGPPRTDPLYSHTWAGTTVHEAPVEIPRQYDYLHHSYIHTGHALGTATYTAPNGKAMDEAPLSHVSGVVALDRLLPAEVGTAQVRIPPAAQGAGVYTLHGIENVRPASLLGATFTERADGLGPLQTTTHFYVPPGLETLRITFTGVSQVNPGITITDPAGNERASMGIDGTGSTTSTTAAQPGLWALHLQGPYRGTFVVSVTTA